MLRRGRAATGCTCTTSRTTHGTPVYVHAKVVRGRRRVGRGRHRDNLNRRSWTHDSELTAAVLDDDAGRARPRDPGRVRRRRPRVRPRPAAAAHARAPRPAPRRRRRPRWTPPTRCAAVEAPPTPSTRGTGRRVGPRPPGRLRTHRPERMPLATRLWADAALPRWSTTRTAVPGGTGSTGDGDRSRPERRAKYRVLLRRPAESFPIGRSR